MKRTMIFVLALCLLLSFVGCANNAEGSPDQSNTTEVRNHETVALEETRPLYFYEENNVEEYLMQDLMYTASTSTYIDCVPIFLTASQSRYDLSQEGLAGHRYPEVAIMTERYYGLNELVEQVSINFDITVGEVPLTTDELYNTVSMLLWDTGEEWLNRGLTNEDKAYGTEAYRAAKSAFYAEFQSKYQGYKVISCMIEFDAGTLKEGYFDESGTTESMGVYFAFSLFDKYTGTAVYPLEANKKISTNVTVDGTEYPIDVIFIGSATPYNNLTGEKGTGIKIPKSVNDLGYISHSTILAFVPEEYDGATFMIRPSDHEQEAEVNALGKEIMSLTELPQFGSKDNLYINPSSTNRLHKRQTELWEEACTATEFDSSAKNGAPTKGLTDIADGIDPEYSVLLDLFSDPENGEWNIYFTNPESNKDVMRLIVANAETFEQYGSTGMIRPGEYIETITLTEYPDDTPIALIAACFDPDTLEYKTEFLATLR